MHIPHRRRRRKKYDDEEIKIKTKPSLNQKKYSTKRWVVERTNSWHNRFRKLFTRYEKNVENDLGLVQFSCCIIIYRKIILKYALSTYNIFNSLPSLVLLFRLVLPITVSPLLPIEPVPSRHTTTTTHSIVFPRL